MAVVPAGVAAVAQVVVAVAFADVAAAAPAGTPAVVLAADEHQ